MTTRTVEDLNVRCRWSHDSYQWVDFKLLSLHFG